MRGLELCVAAVRWTLLEELADGHIAARAAVSEMFVVGDIASRLGRRIIDIGLLTSKY
jgi:hypothetical protein